MAPAADLGSGAAYDREGHRSDLLRWRIGSTPGRSLRLARGSTRPVTPSRHYRRCRWRGERQVVDEEVRGAPPQIFSIDRMWDSMAFIAHALSRVQPSAIMTVTQKAQMEKMVSSAAAEALVQLRAHEPLCVGKCIARAKAHGHPERSDQTIWEVFEEERPELIPYRGPASERVSRSTL
jgi:hypothetical protein